MSTKCVQGYSSSAWISRLYNEFRSLTAKGRSGGNGGNRVEKEVIMHQPESWMQINSPRTKTHHHNKCDWAPDSLSVQASGSSFIKWRNHNNPHSTGFGEGLITSSACSAALPDFVGIFKMPREYYLNPGQQEGKSKWKMLTFY